MSDLLVVFVLYGLILLVGGMLVWIIRRPYAP